MTVLAPLVNFKFLLTAEVFQIRHLVLQRACSITPDIGVGFAVGDLRRFKTCCDANLSSSFMRSFLTTSASNTAREHTLGSADSKKSRDLTEVVLHGAQLELELLEFFFEVVFFAPRHSMRFRRPATHHNNLTSCTRYVIRAPLPRTEWDL